MSRYTQLPAHERVPDYYLDCPQSRAVLEASAEASLTARDAILDACGQLWVSSATWGLALWELLLDITPDPADSPEDRRRSITAKLRGSGTCSAGMVSSVAQAITGYGCVVVEHPEDYTFSLILVGDKPGFVDIPARRIIDAVEQIKPAHLQFIIEGITWRDLEAMEYTWAMIEAEELRWYDMENKVMVQKRS